MKFSVLLYKHGLPVQSGQSLNIGLDGMYVAAAGWRRHEQLMVEFTGHQGAVSMRIPAIVVHRREDGIGLMFDEVTAGQRRQLRAWLFSRSEAMTAGEGDDSVVADQRAVA